MTNQEAIQGIDVSRHQGDVDFKTVWKRGGMSFAYVKATEGRDYLDPWFIRNWNKLLELDGDFGRGAYMFSRPDSIGGAADGKAEADDFCEALKSVGGCVDGAGPPVIDYEKYSGKGTAANLAYLESAIKTIEDRLGRSPMIYTGRNVWNYQTDNSDRWAHLPLWLVEYTSKPEPRTLQDLPWENYALWQWSGGGGHAIAKPVEGAGQVDVNRLGPGIDFKAFFRLTNTATPDPDRQAIEVILRKTLRLTKEASDSLEAALELLGK